MSTDSKETMVSPVPEEGQSSLPWTPPTSAQEMTLPRESQIITFGDRITYTFTVGKDVGSIHFDMGRGEVFYRGHNVRNLELEHWQMDLLHRFQALLRGDEKYHRFDKAYSQTLEKVLPDQKRLPSL